MFVWWRNMRFFSWGMLVSDTRPCYRSNLPSPLVLLFPWSGVPFISYQSREPTWSRNEHTHCHCFVLLFFIFIIFVLIFITLFLFLIFVLHWHVPFPIEFPTANVTLIFSPTWVHFPRFYFHFILLASNYFHVLIYPQESSHRRKTFPLFWYECNRN